MELKCLVVGISSAIAGGIVQYVISSHIWPNRHKVYTWTFAFRDHKKLGIPGETDLVLDRDGYSLGYSYQYKCALWVSYIVSKHSIGVDLDRGEIFYPDPDIPSPHRVSPDDFKNTGYDKGHLAPSSSIDFSRRSNDQTFAMSNIALQDPKLNRQAWGSLEGLIRDWTVTKGKLLITVGPLYNQRPRRINDIPLPNGFYQVIYSFKHKRAIGFILPNEDVKASQLWNYAKTVKDVEKETGYTFFKKMDKNLQKKVKAELDISWWKEKAD
jgi:endonuclease G